jgi:hypothetical protein
VKLLFLEFCGGVYLESLFDYTFADLMRSEVCHAKTSLFLSKNESSSASSLGDKSYEIITVLSDTLGLTEPFWSHTLVR